MKGYVHPSKKEIIFRYKQNMIYLIGTGYIIKKGGNMMEDIIFELIANGGNAKSLSYEAIMESEKGNYDHAEGIDMEVHNSLKTWWQKIIN